jgi:enamine deaminase RidA (YjgF/YER057c/UK114 family)
MNATLKSLIFWVVLIVVGVGIWNLSTRFERSGTERVDAAQPAAEPGAAVDPEAKLKELGITLPTPGAPIANYVNAVQTGNLLFLAGKGPLPQDGKDVVGRLGKDMTVDQGYQAARSVAIAHLAVLKKELGDLKRVTRIVKVLGMVNSDPAFTQQPAVVNGYSDLMVAVFGDRGKHARSAVGMATLPGGIPVEVEVIVEIAPVR